VGAYQAICRQTDTFLPYHNQILQLVGKDAFLPKKAVNPYIASRFISNVGLLENQAESLTTASYALRFAPYPHAIPRYFDEGPLPKLRDWRCSSVEYQINTVSQCISPFFPSSAIRYTYIRIPKPMDRPNMN
jgi:hypothetical protein